MKVRIIERERFNLIFNKFVKVFYVQKKCLFSWKCVKDGSKSPRSFKTFDDAVNFLKCWDGESITMPSDVILEVDLEAFQREFIIDGRIKSLYLSQSNSKQSRTS